MNEPNKSKISDILLLTEFKFIMTLFLSLLAFDRYTMMPDRVHMLCLIAMLFSTGGDICLMNYQGIPSYAFKGKQFYAGTIFFAIAHIFYRQMFRQAMPEPIILGWGALFSLVIMMFFFIVIGEYKLYESSGLFNTATGIYTGLIFANCAAAFNTAYYMGGKYLFAFCGVICFIISDLLILIREKRNDTPSIRKLIWILYPVAQILIIMNV